MRNYTVLILVLLSLTGYGLPDNQPWLTATYSFSTGEEPFLGPLEKMPEMGKRLFYYIHNNNVDEVNKIVETEEGRELIRSNRIFATRAFIIYSPNFKEVDHEIIKSLVRNGANLDIAGEPGNLYNYTCLHWATIRQQEVSIIQTIIHRYLTTNKVDRLIALLMDSTSSGETAHNRVKTLLQRARLWLGEDSLDYQALYETQKPLLIMLDPNTYL